jgi:glycine cleavage system H protein
VYADIKVSPGDTIQQGDLVAVVESVKASSDITAPISGKVLEINNVLNTSPELINSEPYGRAWIMKVEITNPNEVNGLLDADAYQDFRS